jgi:hypothetical protein
MMIRVGGEAGSGVQFKDSKQAEGSQVEALEVVSTHDHIPNVLNGNPRRYAYVPIRYVPRWVAQA